MISDVQKRKIEHLFNVLDLNKNGELQPDDFTIVADRISNILGHSQNSPERLSLHVKSHRLFIQLLTDIDKKDTSISKDEWTRLFVNMVDKDQLQRYIHRIATYIFSLFDQNIDKAVSQEEFLDMFRVYNISDEYVTVAFKKLDENGDGSISKDEIINGFQDFFESPDPTAKGNWIFGKWNED